MSGCTDGTSPTGRAEPAQTTDSGPHHTNRNHTGDVAYPSYWVRSPFDRFALFVEESGPKDAPGGGFQRAVIKAYTPAREGNGTVGAVVWRDETAYQVWYQTPVFLWDLKKDQVWIVTRSGPDKEGEIRVVTPSADGTWTSRAVAHGDYTTLPKEVEEAVAAEQAQTGN